MADISATNIARVLRALTVFVPVSLPKHELAAADRLADEALAIADMLENVQIVREGIALQEPTR